MPLPKIITVKGTFKINKENSNLTFVRQLWIVKYNYEVTVEERDILADF